MSIRNFVLCLAAIAATLPTFAQSPNTETLPVGENVLTRRVLLPTQWSLDPVGKSRPLGVFPMNMRLSPDGKYLAVVHCGVGEHEIMILDADSGRTISRTSEPNLFYGLVFSADGSTLYASGGETEVVYAFPFAKGYLAAPRVLKVGEEKEQRVPCGIALSPDGATITVAESWGNAVTLLDEKSGAIRARIAFEKETRPYDVRYLPDGKTLVASLWGGAGIAIIDPEKPDATPRRVATGDVPNELAMTRDGARVFVSNANINTISVIDTKTWAVKETLNTAIYPDALEGSTPNSIALSADDKQLYVANAGNNCVAVFNIAEPGKTHAVGLVPVGWYPTSVRLSADGKRLFVANAKGFSSKANTQGPNPYLAGAAGTEASDTAKHPSDSGATPRPRISEMEYIGRIIEGGLSIVKLPDDEDEYARWTQKVLSCSPYRSDKGVSAKRPDGNPIPAKVGGASPIKYCFYVIKENRTYDQIFGDMSEGNGDPNLCLFPEKFTPNHHALAREFVLLDNFYVESQVSADGHEWTTSAYSNDFVEKTWPSNYGDHGLDYPAEGAYKTALPTAGYIWDKCAEAKVPYRSLGEFVNHPNGVDKPGVPTVPALIGHIDEHYVGWDLDYLDVKRAERFISEFNREVAAGTWPNFCIVRLPNDHTAGSKEGAFTPRAFVADNDLALGMVIEAITKSPIWKESAIFVIEDDAQAGPDHVDAHRVVALAISPYTRGRGTDSTMYSTASMLRTMELCLGLQPMSQYDAGARPMYNAFRNTADLTPYTLRPVSEEMRTQRNSADAWGREFTAQLHLEKEDAGNDQLFNEILWRNVMGANAPVPAPVRATFIHPIADGDEDEDGD